MAPLLDWRPRHDPRSRAYAIRDRVGLLLARKRTWEIVPRLDQGQEGACVGFGISHALGGQPDPQLVADAFARALYEEAKLLDDWPGEDYEGTSVLAGCKAAQSLGRITGYSWCFGVDDVLKTVANIGPVVVGVWWYDGMMTPDRNDGLVAVRGAKVGGHCVCVNGWHPIRRLVRFRNSWGPDWGRRGNGFLPVDDFEGLLADDGEAAVLTKGP